MSNRKMGQAERIAMMDAEEHWRRSLSDEPFLDGWIAGRDYALSRPDRPTGDGAKAAAERLLDRHGQCATASVNCHGLKDWPCDVVLVARALLAERRGAGEVERLRAEIDRLHRALVIADAQGPHRPMCVMRQPGPWQPGQPHCTCWKAIVIADIADKALAEHGRAPEGEGT